MRFVRPAVAGVLAAAAGLAVAELLAAAARPGGAPVVAVGGAVIDATPTPVKEFAVRTFGTYDKPLLLGGIGLALLAYAATVGVLARRRPLAGTLGVALFGLVGGLAAMSRPAAGPVDALPSVAGAFVAVVALRWLRRPPAGLPFTGGSGG
ncbi:MAG TPA: molybdopterin-binding oxidoreductase, partial [Pilimelia sp.]|nr:molybdopterin-binding oxidoreductase [Pilimelia sp.]